MSPAPSPQPLPWPAATAAQAGADAAPRAPYNPQARICLDCGVRRHALFGVLDAQALEQMHYRVLDLALAPGQSLYALNAPAQAAYTVREGLVRLERCSERGQRRIVRLAGPGDLIGLEAMLGQTHAADALACTPVKVCRLPRSLVDELAAARPQLLHDLMKRWQAALDETEEWLTELTQGSARWRMLRLMLKLSEFGSADGTVWLPSRQQMGAMLGMTVETASRLVSAFKREGLIADSRPGAGQAQLDMARLMTALRETADE